MGQFSWLDCITGEQIIDNKERDVYVLIPKEFGGGHIIEHCYDGYGHFGGYDIFDLVATWNREALSKKPNFIFPHALERANYVLEISKQDENYSEIIDVQIHNKEWYKAYSDLDLTEEEVVDIIKDSDYWVDDWRAIGIDISCYDEDNEALPFPIKITHDSHACYELCNPSNADPNQGWECDDEDDEDEWWDEED